MAESPACFCIVALVEEEQNDVTVAKPVLNQLDVLRLCTALGGLPALDLARLAAADASCVQAFDEDVARLLRDGGDSPRVQVVGAFGKKTEMTSYLQSLGIWSDELENTLPLCGLYAVRLPPPDEASEEETVVLFAWLDAEYFHPDRIRQHAVYILRYLTCLTTDITLCIADDDKPFLNSVGDGSLDMDGSDVAFSSVLMEISSEHLTDDTVDCCEIGSNVLPNEFARADVSLVVKGAFPGLVCVARGREVDIIPNYSAVTKLRGGGSLLSYESNNWHQPMRARDYNQQVPSRLRTTDRLHAWRVDVVPPSSRIQLHRLGYVDMPDGETLVGAFTVLDKNLILVSTAHVGGAEDDAQSFVRRVTFTSTQYAGTSTKLRTFHREISRCEFDIADRSLTLFDGDDRAFVYRLDRTFGSMNHARTIYLERQTALELPLQGVAICDGVFHMIGSDGITQSLSTRNMQPSNVRGVIYGAPPRCVFTLQSGAIIGWLGPSEDGSTEVRFILTADQRDVPPQTTPWTGFIDEVSEYNMIGDMLLVADKKARRLCVFRFTATLSSSSCSVHEINLFPETDHAGVDSIKNHWLWTLWHLYEKFPVRGHLEPTPPPEAALIVSFFCASVDASERGSLEDGCKQLKHLVMQELFKRNKPLYGLDYSKLNRPLFSIQNVEELLQEYQAAPLRSVSSLLCDLAGLIPIQICRTEDNTLKLLLDGIDRPLYIEDDGVSQTAATLAQRLRFGLLSPLLQSWKGKCIVVTSMGKQSTGKSYYLNHLTGTSFATAGSRCTDGAWMSVKILPSRALLVVIDFEGLGSLERTPQEEVFLSVLNAGVSMLTILRMGAHLDKETDAMFSKFQEASQYFKSDKLLFRGRLAMSVKDVNAYDVKEVTTEFRHKLQRIVNANGGNNFVRAMYKDVTVDCTFHFETARYFTGLRVAGIYIENTLMAQSDAGFATGQQFLDCIRLMMAKISVKDWKSMSESWQQFRIVEALDILPKILQFGSKDAEPETEPSLEVRTSTGGDVLFDEVCAQCPSLVEKWRGQRALLDSVEDSQIDLGCCDISSTITADAIESATEALQVLYSQFVTLLATRDSDSCTRPQKALQKEFDTFLSFIVRRRCLSVGRWSRAWFEGDKPEQWRYEEQKAVGYLQRVFVRCHETCSKCMLGCMKASGHTDFDGECTCSTNHICTSTCSYCGGMNKTASCSKAAGHEDRCECATGDHTCRQPCRLQGASNCGNSCTKKVGHERDDGDEHRCSVGMHKCGAACMGVSCTRRCVLDVETPHDEHRCPTDRCVARCDMEGCFRACASVDHFHGSSIVTEGTGEARVVHMCDGVHACPAECNQPGVCQTVVVSKQSSSFNGGRDSFEYTNVEMQGVRNKCVRELDPGMTAHDGEHRCCPANALKEVHADGGAARHICDVRCPCCSYFCLKGYGHTGLHRTTHGNMRNTVFLAADNDIDIMERRYAAGDSGIAEMCNSFCWRSARGHVHYVDCEKNDDGECAHGGEIGRRHVGTNLIPTPSCDQDMVLHSRFWEIIGFEDPCPDQHNEFNLCGYKCDAPDHANQAPSFCVLPAWHEPAAQPRGVPDDYLYVDGHKFDCRHGTGAPLHTVFVLDSSGSMWFDWHDVIAAVQGYLNRRIRDRNMLDRVSIVTFTTTASVVFRAQSIREALDKTPPYRIGSTSYAAGLNAAAEVLRSTPRDRRALTPVLVFLSDGKPSDQDEGERAAERIAREFAGDGLLAFVVGFGAKEVPVLKRVAQHLGGEYHHALTRKALRATFHNISPSQGTVAGLAVAPRRHEHWTTM